MREQVSLAIQEATQIIFLVDGRAGLTPGDRLAAQLLRQTDKPVHLAVNKIDTINREDLVWEFSELGMGEPVALSALHGLGVDDLLDHLAAKMPAPQPEEEELDEPLKVAIVGRPNVGKSSIVNQFLGRDAMVVYDTPGTTRDAVDTPFHYKNKPFILVDTAGVRAKKNISDDVEKYAVVRAIRAIEECDVAVLVLDGKQGVTEQDERIAGLINEAGRACVLAINKWDLVAKDNHTLSEYTRAIQSRLPFLDYAPLVFISAKTRQRLSNLLDLVDHVGDQHALRISTGVLNRTLEDILVEAPPPTRHGRALKVFFLSQTGIKPPAFALFVNNPELLHFSYMRRLKTKLREKFGFEGTPLFVMLRRRK
jgi:GTP-binding protein